MYRDYIGVEFEICDVDNNLVANNPVSYNGKNMPFYACANYKDCGNVNFSGVENQQETIKIPFDLTPIIKKIYKDTEICPKNKLNIIVSVCDESMGTFPVILGDVKIVEPITGKEVICLDTTDVIVAENLGCNVEWVDGAREVVITK